ncbi:hypothetical protein B1R94_02110 [Mycolicibacterium litorale]|nr:hypothetical protein B1R94_02110 [Mycolicibacterium litorale]
MDFSPDPNLDRVGRITSGLGERIREEDPREMFDELVSLCAWHPAKAAQIIMCFAVWFDPLEDTPTLVGRARAVSASRLAAS